MAPLCAKYQKVLQFTTDDDDDLLLEAVKNSARLYMQPIYSTLLVKKRNIC